MNTSYDKNTAVVIFPPISNGILLNSKLKNWLAKSDITVGTERQELLQLLTKELKLPYPKQGLAALRVWGQSGVRPNEWITALDPIHLEPRLDHLCMHALNWSDMPISQMHNIIEHLQSSIGDQVNFKYKYSDSYAYLYSNDPIYSGLSPAYIFDRENPNSFLKAGMHSGIHKNLLSEIEMSLHNHNVNLEREKEGELPINSLWLWGSGKAPEISQISQPPLFSSDPLLVGYWHSISSKVHRWPGNISSCLKNSKNSFIAEVPFKRNSPDYIERNLLDLQEALRIGRLDSLTLLFRNNLRASITQCHNLRIWRRRSYLIEKLCR